MKDKLIKRIKDLKSAVITYPHNNGLVEQLQLQDGFYLELYQDGDMSLYDSHVSDSRSLQSFRGEEAKEIRALIKQRQAEISSRF